MSEQIPAGWYPDPKDTTGDPRAERWWDGKGWTATTRPVPKVVEGQVLDAGPTVRYPEPPLLAAVPATPKRSVSRPVALAATIAAVAGLAVGSGITYLAMDGHSSTATSMRKQAPPKRGFGGPNGEGGRSSARSAVDAVNGISLPVPSGWDGGTTTKGFAAITTGAYVCADGNNGCSLGGVTTGRIQGTDPKQAAQSDIASAAKDSYGDVKSHQELKSESVTVDGRSGYLVRWKVAASQGNDGYVETVVFPTADSSALVSVHFGFDIAPKAPGVDQMDTIVKSITDYKGPALDGGSGGTRT